jgi:hypothetical protein
MEIRMRTAHALRSSTLLLVVSVAGCGEPTPPPAAVATSDAASTSNALTQTKKRRGPISKGKQTIEKRREYNAASPDGPPSKY